VVLDNLISLIERQRFMAGEIFVLLELALQR
jgi:hypothetical protein